MPEQIITKLLKIAHVCVEKIETVPDDTCEIYLKQTSATFICSKCGGEVTHKFGYRVRRIRDFGIFERKTYLVVRKYRLKCSKCGIKFQKLSFSEEYSRCTIRFEELVARMCRITSVKQASEFLELDWKTVKNIDKKYLERSFGKIDCSDLRMIAVDEVSSKKGHNYFTVVLDLERMRVAWVGKGRSKQTLNSFFREIGPAVSRQIKAIAIDMWEPYMASINRYALQAEVVFDKFHIIKAYSRVIDQVRNNEYRNATEKGKEVIKGSKYILLKNNENLSRFEGGWLEKLFSLNRRLAKVYILKDELKNLWSYDDIQKAQEHLEHWIKMARRSRIKPLKQFARKLEFFACGILAHCKYPISTAALEGFNNKIKVIKRVAYGFHDDEYFILKIKQACSGIAYAYS